MRNFRLLFAANLLILLGGFSPGIQAVDATIKVSSIAEVEVEVVKNGKKEIMRIPPDKAVPGTEVIFTNTFENLGGKTASDIVINNPVPNDTGYKAGSAIGRDTVITFSADGGKTFGTAENLKIRGADGKQRSALPGEYTHIRWTYKGQLAAGKSGEVGFRAIVK